MKNNVFRYALLAAFFAFGGTASAGERTMVISTGEWAPIVSESLEGYGIGPTIVTAAFKKVGIRVEYKFFPWARAMQEVEKGNADFSGFWFFTEERSEKFSYSDKVFDSPNVFFYLKSKPFNWHGYQGFPKKTVGVTLGYSYSEEFDNAVKESKIKTEVEESDILNFRKLLRGRISAFPISEIVGYDMLKSSFSPEEVAKLAVHPKKISSAPLHLISASGGEKNEKRIREFNKGLRMLTDSGELEIILQRYK